MRPALLLWLMAAPALAEQGLEDRHLPVVPRTADEAARVAGVLAPVADFSASEPFEDLPGGAATVPARSDVEAFSQPSASLGFDGRTDFAAGNAIFSKTWVAAPALVPESDGLGPFYNARACGECHPKDGRGHPPEGPEDSRVSMLLRLSVPGGQDPEGISEWLSSRPHPVLGGQLQDFAAPGMAAEGRLEVSYADLPVTLADGTVVVLRAPTYAISGADGGAGVMISPRIGPQMIGLGLLEAIPAADILVLADALDADGDGISGRAQIVPSAEYGVPMLGRFGWKAGMPTLREQVADAFGADMGLSNPLRPAPWGDCTAAQAQCRDAPHGAEPGVRDGLEVDGASLDLVAFYTRNLAVPARRRPDDPQVLRGKAVFHALNCQGCHVPKHVTHRLIGQPEQSFQLIWPYTDLLLHDMGPGLADNRPEGRANGQEWRTPPLWGIGLTEAVTGHTQFLHDGRARSLLEAILWHGGEAQAAREGVVALPAADRAALMAFLESL